MVAQWTREQEDRRAGAAPSPGPAAKRQTLGCLSALYIRLEIGISIQYILEKVFLQVGKRHGSKKERTGKVPVLELLEKGFS